MQGAPIPPNPEPYMVKGLGFGVLNPKALNLTSKLSEQNVRVLGFLERELLGLHLDCTCARMKPCAAFRICYVSKNYSTILRTILNPKTLR